MEKCSERTKSNLFCCFLLTNNATAEQIHILIDVYTQHRLTASDREKHRNPSIYRILQSRVFRFWEERKNEEIKIKVVNITTVCVQIRILYLEIKFRLPNRKSISDDK